MTPRDRQDLFPRLCEVGNHLEQVRDDTYPQGALWLRLDAALAALDAVIDTLAECPPDGGGARHGTRLGDTP